MENNSEQPQFQFQEDRISKLPDDLLVVILSKLTLKEAVQTSILSHLHFVTTFDESNRKLPRRYMAVFANLVNRVLDSRGGSRLQEFKVVCELGKRCQNEIDRWLEYALGLGVQRLELILDRYGITDDLDNLYDFPNNLLHQVQRAPNDIFSCLRVLYLIGVNISGEAIQCLLLKCPLLEDLRVIESRVLINVVVSGPSLLLKHLEITYCHTVKSIKICNTNIVSIKGYSQRKAFSFPSCHAAYLSLQS